MVETPRTLSEAQNLPPLYRSDRKAFLQSCFVSRRQWDLKCDGPFCHGPADYLIPKGSTPRTSTRELLLCVECFSQYVERLRTSILLDGEECEWRLTLHHAENLYDGAHDWRRDLLKSKCGHRSCEAARKAKESDLASPNEESA